MFSFKDVHMLAAHPGRHENSVLTVYLDGSPDRDSTLKRMLAEFGRGITEVREAKRFHGAARRVEQFVSVAQRGRNLAIVCDEFDGSLWTAEVAFPLQSVMRWSGEPFLQPLIAAIDEFQGYAVILSDQLTYRIFAVLEDEIEELDSDLVSKLRRLVERLDGAMQEKHLLRLIVAGPPDSAKHLSASLPSRLRSCVIGLLDLPMDTDTRDVLAATRDISQEYERNVETRLVQELVNAGESARTVVGIDKVLRSLNQKRVWRLVYAAGLRMPGYLCRDCGGLFSSEHADCIYCRGSLLHVSDIVGHAVQAAFRDGATVEVVRGNAIEEFKPAGSIGAYLRRPSLVTAS